MNWRVLNSQKIISDQWLTVRADTCRTSGGDIISPYYVIEGRDWCNVTAVSPSGQVVLVHEYRHGFGRRLLGLPGGLIDPEDHSPALAAQRELLEEVGISTLRSIELLAPMVVNPSTHTNTGYSFLAIVDDDEINNLSSREPDIEVHIQPFVDLVRDVIDGNITISGYDAASILRAAFSLSKKNIAAAGEIKKLVISYFDHL